MSPDDLRAFVEAALLVSKGPVSATQIAEAVGAAEIDTAEIDEVLDRVRASWDIPSSGIRIERVAGGWRAVTPAGLDPYLRSLLGLQQRQRLSQAALEVLAIVAHRQPVTQPEVNFIRGANSAAVLRTLLDRRLVRVAGRKKVVGKPFLYRTTREFLVHFGLDSLEELPDPEKLVEPETSAVASDPAED